MDVIVTTSEAARLLRTHPSQVRRRCEAGEFRHAARDGRRWLINLSREFPAVFGQTQVEPRRSDKRHGSGIS